MKRIVVIDKELCQPQKCNYACFNACPKNRAGEKCIIIKKEENAYPKIDEDKCIGCGLCIKKCDFNALKVVNLPEALKENPIFQYGPNSFRLFRLPIPFKGVTGILGENGTGKTTSLKILSGEIKPNLGKEFAEKKEILEAYRGTELQNYLKDLLEGKIKTVYKEQQVDKILNLFSSLDEMEIKEEFIKKFNIENRKLSEMSGGELQKVCIAYTLSKNADIYFLDEPTSFLDIKERLNIAKIIREFSEKEERSVIVVEHDLAVLDYLADRVHIIYGEPGAFGVVSKPYSTKQGINSFLNGYLKEENVRIGEPIKFLETEDVREWKDVLIKFSNIKKSFENFCLEISGEEIFKNEVLGIFGANSLGKTTFAKILAGLLDFEGYIEKNIKISYKPQYITSIQSEITVEELFSSLKNSIKDLVKDEKTSDEIETNFEIILSKLDIRKIFHKKISNLSGGELQRVAIASCLVRDADLYLLDEPSAYLDVKQRMSLIKLIKFLNKTFIIIDHDLTFLSCVSNRCMLFRGEPKKKGYGKIFPLYVGINEFLKEVNITFRRDEETRRLRANKPDSVKDREQKSSGIYFEK